LGVFFFSIPIVLQINVRVRPNMKFSQNDLEHFGLP
jgi:hypothetical protein